MLDPTTLVELGLRSSSPATQYYEWEATPAPTTTGPNNHLLEPRLRDGGSPAETQYYEWEATPAPTVTGPLPSSRETSFESQQPLESSAPSATESQNPQSQNTQSQNPRSQNPRSKKPSRNQLSEDEKLSVVRWLLTNRQMYADRNTSKTAFWKICAEYIESEMQKSYRYIDRAVAKWEKARRSEIEEAKMESGVAKSDTDWLQAVDEWIVFLDDLKAEEAERRDSKVAEEADARQIAQNEQSRMASRMADRRRTLEEAEETEVVEIEDPDPAATNTVPGSAPPEPSRKKRKSQKGKGNDIEEFGKSLSSALQSFGSTFAKEMGSVMKEAVAEPMNKVHGEIQGMKQEQQQLMTDIRTENQDQGRLILEILSELRKR